MGALSGHLPGCRPCPSGFQQGLKNATASTTTCHKPHLLIVAEAGTLAQDVLLMMRSGAKAAQMQAGFADRLQHISFQGASFITYTCEIPCRHTLDQAGPITRLSHDVAIETQ